MLPAAPSGEERDGAEGRSEAGGGEWVVRKCGTSVVSGELLKIGRRPPVWGWGKGLLSGKQEMDSGAYGEPKPEISRGCL